MLSIDGITTGLDTTSIIEQLMNVERLGVTRLQAQQCDVRHRAPDRQPAHDVVLGQLRRHAAPITAAATAAPPAIGQQHDARVRLALQQVARQAMRRLQVGRAPARRCRWRCPAARS